LALRLNTQKTQRSYAKFIYIIMKIFLNIVFFRYLFYLWWQEYACFYLTKNISLCILLPLVIINHKELETLINFAKSSLPKECCAFLIGTNSRDEVIIYNIVTLRNYDESIFSFSIDPQDLFFGYKQADQLGLEVVGVFHSHPSLPFPSSKDKKFMRLNPFIWLIYSTVTEEYKGFIYRQQIKEVKLHIIMG